MNKIKTQATYRPEIRSNRFSIMLKGLIVFIILACSDVARAAASTNDDPEWEVKTIFGVTVGSRSGLGGYINAALNGLYSIIGVVTMVRILMGAYRYMSAGGNPETISNAKNTIRHALTGLVLVLLAYTLTTAFLDPSFLGF